MRLSDVPLAHRSAPNIVRPPLTDLIGPAETRNAAFRAHVIQRAAMAGEVIGAHALRLLPPEAASAIGARLARRAREKARHARSTERMRHSIRTLRPELADDADGVEAILDRWWTHTGRILAECTQAGRLSGPDRMRWIGKDYILAAADSGRPVICLTVHTGSWECLARPMRRMLGPRSFVTFQPQQKASHNAVLQRLRRRAGITTIAPGPHMARTVTRLVASGHPLQILADEVTAHGHVKFPRFGRPMPKNCNITFACRLAVKTGALVMVGKVTRVAPVSFECVVPPPIDAAGQTVAALADRLEADFAPHIITNLEQWYMLPWLDLTRQA